MIGALIICPSPVRPRNPHDADPRKTQTHAASPCRLMCLSQLIWRSPVMLTYSACCPGKLTQRRYGRGYLHDSGPGGGRDGRVRDGGWRGEGALPTVSS